MNEFDISTYKFGVHKGHKGTNELPPATTSSLIQDKTIGELVDSWKWAPGDKERDATSDLAVSSADQNEKCTSLKR